MLGATDSNSVARDADPQSVDSQSVDSQSVSVDSQSVVGSETSRMWLDRSEIGAPRHRGLPECRLPERRHPNSRHLYGVYFDDALCLQGVIIFLLSFGYIVSL